MARRRVPAWFTVVVASIAGLTGAAGCRNAARKLAGGGPSPPALAPAHGLYRDARGDFTSKLRVEGPAPQKADVERPAPASDAAEFTYYSGGVPLRAWVSRDAANPPAAERRPAVVYLHGGFAFDEGDWAQSAPYREAGFIVMTPTLRGENGQPGPFTAFYQEVDDVLMATSALVKLPGVDPERVFVAGHSAGGTLSMLAAISAPFYRAGASFSGSPDQRAFFGEQPELAPFDGSDPREYAIRSPVAYATNFRCPFRLYFGEDEAGFFRKYTDETALRARAAGLDVESIAVAGDHLSALAREIPQSIAFFRAQGAGGKPDGAAGGPGEAKPKP